MAEKMYLTMQQNKNLQFYFVTFQIFWTLLETTLSIHSWEDYMDFNHPIHQTGLVYCHNTSNEREKYDFIILYI